LHLLGCANLEQHNTSHARQVGGVGSIAFYAIVNNITAQDAFGSAWQCAYPKCQLPLLSSNSDWT
jgi:hypothetical protein